MTDEPSIELPGDNIVGFMRGAMSEGLSPTAALNQFRSAEGSPGFRTARWYDLWNSEAAVMARYPETLELSATAVPNFADREPFEMGSAAGYAAKVRVLLWDVESQQFVDQWFTHWSADPFTIAEAEQAAIDAWSGVPVGDTGNVYAVGATVARVGTTVPYQRGG